MVMGGMYPPMLLIDAYAYIQLSYCFSVPISYTVDSSDLAVSLRPL